MRRALQTALEWIDGHASTYEELAAYVWDHAELGLVEFHSSAKLQDYLAGNGFRITPEAAHMKTAFIAEWGTGKPVIGLLGEFDALPNLSQEPGAAVEKRLREGAPGHGCGHNLLGAASALAAVAIAKAMEKHHARGTVRFFGTPAEETLIGKVYMNRDGVFDGTDVMLSWHPKDVNGVDYSSSLAMDNIKFRFYGRASHAAAAPEAGRSALDGVELMNVGANYMREHVAQEARIHYIVTKGGEAPNVVPAFAEAWYFLRAPRRSQVDEMREWLMDIATGAALMTQTRMEHRLLTASTEWLPSKTLARMGAKIVKMLGAPRFTAEDQASGRRLMEGAGRTVEGVAYRTDIAFPDLTRTFPDVEVTKVSMDVNYTWRFPSVNFFAATVAEGTPLHSWLAVAQTKSAPALKAGLQASKYLAAAGLECLANPGLVRDAWVELKEQVGRFGYREPVPSDVHVPSFEDLYG